MASGAVPGIWSIMVAVLFWLPSVAVITAAAMLEELSVPVVAVKVTLLCPDCTVTLEGTVTAELLLFKETEVLAVAD
jgi:hypothetical protein